MPTWVRRKEGHREANWRKGVPEWGGGIGAGVEVGVDVDDVDSFPPPEIALGNSRQEGKDMVVSTAEVDEGIPRKFPQAAGDALGTFVLSVGKVLLPLPWGRRLQFGTWRGGGAGLPFWRGRRGLRWGRASPPSCPRLRQTPSSEEEVAKEYPRFPDFGAHEGGRGELFPDFPRPLGYTSLDGSENLVLFSGIRRASTMAPIVGKRSPHFWRGGKLRRCLLWREGMKRWRPIKMCPEFFLPLSGAAPAGCQAAGFPARTRAGTATRTCTRAGIGTRTRIPADFPKSDGSGERR